MTELLRNLLTANAPEAVAAFAVAAVRDVTGAEVSWCGLLHEDVLRMAAHSGLRTVRMANEWTLALGDGVGGRVAAEGRPLWVRDYRHDPRRAPTRKTMIDEEGIRAAMCAPVSAGGQVLGVLFAARRDVYDWSSAEITLLSELAADCGAALGRLRRGPAGPETGNDDGPAFGEVLSLQRDVAEVLVASGDLAAGLTVLTRRLGLGTDVVDAEGQSLLGEGPAPEPVHFFAPLPGGSGERLQVSGVRDLSATERVAVQAAATVFGMQLGAARASAAVERRARRDLLDALLAEAADPRVVRSEAALLGVDLRRAHHVVCIGAHRQVQGPTGEPAPLSGAAVTQLERVVGLAYPESLTVVHEGDLLVLLPARAEARNLGGSIRELIAGRTLPPEGLAAGVGRRCMPLREFRESFGEATLALDLARRQPEPGAVFTAADLGLSGLLAASGSSRRTLEAMVDSTLGVLLEADRRDGSQHVHTLRVWLAVDRHLQRTAKLLHVHPNTVRYRLTRIGVLLKLDLRHVDTRFQIDLALRILEALERTTPAGE